MSDAMHDLRVGFARGHGLPDDMADQIQGQTIDELKANAVALAEELKQKAEANPNQAELLAFGQDKAESTRRLLDSLHGSREPAAEELSPPGDWGGGVRETPPLETDPYQAHNETVLNVLQEGRGAGPGVVYFGRPPVREPAKDGKPDEGDWRKEGGT